jgi:proline dehydrogenase
VQNSFQMTNLHCYVPAYIGKNWASGSFCVDNHGIATHDEKRIHATIVFARQAQISPTSFEFQMLYGVRRDLQKSLVKEGWRCRVYIPFGMEWYPYLMRRLAERPANAIFILKNLLR